MSLSLCTALRMARFSFQRRATVLAGVGLFLPAVAQAQTPPTLDSVSPATQRVHEIITLRGSDFGTFLPGTSRVIFREASGLGGFVANPIGPVDQATPQVIPPTPPIVDEIEANAPYVWRDDYIQVRVPTGDMINGVKTLIGKGPLVIEVVTANGKSNTQDFQVITTVGTLSFVQLTQIQGSQDVSTVLGSPNMNLARTKDAEIGDVNNDGFPEIFDSNSNNQLNNTHGVERFNLGDGTFQAIPLEPTSPQDNGNFANSISATGVYPQDSIIYDADLVDLNNDEFVDYVQTSLSDINRIRVSLGNFTGFPGRFEDRTLDFFPVANFPGTIDDLAHIDINYDGFVDIGAGFRFSSQGGVYINGGGTTFSNEILLTITGGASVHDCLFIDANDDGWHDVLLANESGNPRLFLHDGNFGVPTFTPAGGLTLAAVSAEASDFDGDGALDIATSQISAGVYMNDPLNPGNFQLFNLDVAAFTYDMDAGDVNLDGFPDIVSAAAIFNGDGDDSARMWLSNGDGSFTDVTFPGAGVMFPGIGDFQRLTADFIDCDNDGDLDVYIGGADGIGVTGFGDAPNQLWENQIIP